MAGKYAEATDDARMVEMAGSPVHIVEGEKENIKITTPSDLEDAVRFFSK
jgi:2-C-methyl-D-erythritol 4-phosphate cytidylyltransferase